MRARVIKPAFFKNEDLGDLPVQCRLLFIGLWCLADRAGRLEDRPKRIKLELFPLDSFEVEPFLDMLKSKKLIIRYSENNVNYISIPNFLKHQKPHVNEQPSIIPEPKPEQESKPDPQITFEMYSTAIALIKEEITEDEAEMSSGEAINIVTKVESTFNHGRKHLEPKSQPLGSCTLMFDTRYIDKTHTVSLAPKVVSTSDQGSKSLEKDLPQADASKMLAPASAALAEIPESLPSDDNHKKVKPPVKKKPEFDLPEWMPLDKWSMFLSHRKAVKAPIVDKAFPEFITKFEKLKSLGWDPDRVIEIIVERGWRWFNPNWVKEDPRNGNKEISARHRNVFLDYYPEEDESSGDNKP